MTYKELLKKLRRAIVVIVPLSDEEKEAGLSMPVSRPVTRPIKNFLDRCKQLK